MEYFVKFENGIFSGLYKQKKSDIYYPYVPTPEQKEGYTATTIGFKWLEENISTTGIYNYVKNESQEEIKKYSTLSIKRELYKLDKWDQIKNLMVQADVSDDYFLANYLSSDDPVFKAAIPKIIELGILSKKEIDEILEKCIWIEN